MPTKSESPWLDYHDHHTDDVHNLGWLTQYDHRRTTEPTLTLADLCIDVFVLISLILIGKNLAS